jgi:aspartate/glutamate racemase
MSEDFYKLKLIEKEIRVITPEEKEQNIIKDNSRKEYVKIIDKMIKIGLLIKQKSKI